MACIRELPNDKAAGPSNIFNEHLKHLELETQTLLLHLIHLIFQVGDTPDKWKIAHVYSILKPTE